MLYFFFFFFSLSVYIYYFWFCSPNQKIILLINSLCPDSLCRNLWCTTLNRLSWPIPVSSAAALLLTFGLCWHTLLCVLCGVRLLFIPVRQPEQLRIYSGAEVFFLLCLVALWCFPHCNVLQS